MPYIKLSYLAVSVIVHILIIFGGSILFAEKEATIGKELKSHQSVITLALLNVKPEAAVTENLIKPDEIIPSPDYKEQPAPPVEEKIIPAKQTDIKKIKSKTASHDKPKKTEQQPEPFRNTDTEPELPLAVHTDNLSAETEAPLIFVDDTPSVENIYAAPVELKFGENNGPCFKNRVNPAYPPRALRLQKEAQVILRLTINANGTLLKTEVAESGGIDFDNAAIEAVQKSTFQAAQRMGQPISSVGLLKIDFVIKRNNKGML